MCKKVQRYIRQSKINKTNYNFNITQSRIEGKNIGKDGED